jgi:hypothetical protein
LTEAFIHEPEMAHERDHTVGVIAADLGEQFIVDLKEQSAVAGWHLWVYLVGVFEET